MSRKHNEKSFTIEIDGLMNIEHPKTIEKNQCVINMDRVPKIEFGDMDTLDRMNALSYDVSKFLEMGEIENSKLSEASSTNFIIHRFANLFGEYRYITIYDNIIDSEFFKKLLTSIDLPKKSFSFSHEHDYDKITISSFILTLRGIVIYFNMDSTLIVYSPSMLEYEDSFLFKFYGWVKKYGNISSKEESQIFVIYRDNYGFRKKSFPLNKNRINMSLSDNYNDDFDEVSDDIIEKLNDKNKSGLVILHGHPGTGKTTYLRYLAGKLERNIIFIPPDMVGHITSPDFIPFLMDNSNSVLIIEDAEPALKRRDSGGRSGAVSNILNMTDGLLSDCLNISIVATFNTDMRDLDEALLRKGRLLKSYKFGKLKKEKAISLLKKLNRSYDHVTGDLSLGEIYYQEDNMSEKDFGMGKVKGFGFKKDPNEDI